MSEPEACGEIEFDASAPTLILSLSKSPLILSLSKSQRKARRLVDKLRTSGVQRRPR
jgi:hypothetical protein